MLRFEFATATRIIFGAGTLKQIGPLAAEMGRRAFVVTGLSTAQTQPLLDLITAQGMQYETFPVANEPTVETVQSGVRHVRHASCDLVIGFGGGSAIDAGKAIAALMTNPGDLLDYLEVIGKGKPHHTAGSALHRHPHDGGHRRRGHAQRRARLARTSRQSQPAQPADAAARGTR